MPKVLVLEDQPSVVAIVRYHLENAGYSGVFAGDVEEAWRHLVTEGPDAAVVDIKLPGSDGWSFLERVRADGRFHKLPVVVLTGLLEPEIADRAESMGAEYLSKPFAASALLDKIQALVKGGSNGSRAAPGTPPPAPAPPSAGPAHKIEMVSIGVVLLLDTFQIEGEVHLPPELKRFSDAWESVMRDPRQFVPVTGCRVTSNATGAVISSPAFMEVRKVDIRGIYPMELTS